jgi:hypothetical protein
MASGTPVVAFRRGLVPEVIEDGVAAKVVGLIGPFSRESVKLRCVAAALVSSEMATNGDSNMSIFKSETTGLEQVEEVEGEIREFVRDVAGRRRHTENDGTMVADNISSLLQRVSASSVQEIDRLISELKILRDRLQDEGARVQREIVEYASLNQAAMQSTKVIAESLSHWKRIPDAPSIDEGA